MGTREKSSERREPPSPSQDPSQLGPRKVTDETNLRIKVYFKKKNTT